MNTKKILIIATVALASIAAGYGLVGLRPADGGSGVGAGSAPESGVGDGAPRIVYLDATGSGRDVDGWDDDERDERDETYEAREHEGEWHEDGEHDDD